ncbi:MAG: TonB-dependent receptor [Erythrobacter sp.]|nr:TonB-dependent receptor [Erythrobacter sp.]MDZ4274022.1 TonB-dependent receptor [Erythrobacter sp.]
MRSTTTGFAGSYRFTLLAGAAVFALGNPVAAFAQDQQPEVDAPDNSNVIIVTASKREQTLQETPISVSVTSGETLENAQIRDVLDLQSVTPSLRVSQLQSASSTTFIIRGFGNGDNNFGIEPSVGVFIDGVFRSRSAAALSDLNMVQRIEVLNGPQSTLFGKNASAGVISVVTKEPQYQFGGQVEASYGNFDAVVLKGEITGPITENIAFSLDGSYNRRDGYARIVNLNEDISDRNRWSGRGQLLFEPTPDLKIRAIADYSKIDEACCTVSTQVAGPTAGAIFAVGGQLDTDFFSLNTFLNQVPINKVENYGGSVQVDWNIGNLTVTSISAYRELTNFQDQDVDFTSADVVREVRDQAVETFTQELRLTSDFDGPLNFLLGGFYFDESISQDSRLTTGAVARPFFDLLAGGGTPGTLSFVEGALGLPQGSIFSAGPLTAEQFSMDNESWSVFGTVDLEPVDGLVFTAGFNYTDDKKTFALAQQSFDELSNINLVDAFIVGGIAQTLAIPPSQVTPAVISGFASNPATAPIFNAIAGQAINPATNPLLGLVPLQFQPPFLALPNAVEPGRTADDELTYLLRVAYQVSNEINVYASYATGFKASSVNLSRDSRPAFGDFIPGPGRSTILAPSSPIRDAGLAVANLGTGSRFAGPEDAEVYEIGIKAQWDGFGINLALFDQTIEGFQSFLFTGTGFQLNNAGKQSVQGFELDTTIRPTDGLVMTFAVTHLDPLFNSFLESPVGDLTGQRPGGIPAWSLATSATYTHEFGTSGNKLMTRVDYSHESNTPINNGLPTFNASLGNTQIFQREVNLVNASMILQLNNGLEVGAWARNLLDDKYIITVFDGVAQAGTVSGYPNQPRTYGGLVRFKF